MKKITAKVKKQIDGWTYNTLIKKLHKEPYDSELFQGINGSYFISRIEEIEKDMSKDEISKVSHKIGW